MASYEKRKSGWSVRYRQIINGEEKNMRLSGYSTKKEAELAYLEAIKKKPTAPKAEITFGELAEKYCEYAATIVKPQSLYETKSRLKNHILPVFGEIAVNDITATKLVEWQTDLAGKYSYKFVCALRAALSAVLAYGNSFYDTANNLSKVKAPKDNALHEEMSIWTPAQYAEFRKAVDNDILRLLFDTLFFTGMRKGEAIALRPSDIKGNIVSVSKTITRKSGSAWSLSTTKTKGSNRRVTLPSWLADLLRGRTGAFLFSFDGEQPIGDRTVERSFKEYAAAAGLPPIRIHDLRHSHASYLLSSGCSIVAVSRRLGHSSVTQTLNTYAHLMPMDDDAIMSAVDRIVL